MRLIKIIEDELKEANKKMKACVDPTEASALAIKIVSLKKEKKDFADSLNIPKPTVEIVSEESQARELLEDSKRWFNAYTIKKNITYQYSESIKMLTTHINGKPERIDHLEIIAHQDYMNEVRSFDMNANGRDAKKMAESDFTGAITIWLNEQHLKKIDELKKTIAFDGRDDSELRKWLRLVTLTSGKEIDLAVIKHALTNMKRKLHGMPVKYHIFIVICSLIHGSGKSEFLSKLLSPFQGFVQEYGLQQIVDPRYIEAWGRNYAFLVNELAGADKADIETLKNKIDCPVVDGLAPYGRRSITVRNNISFFGTANKDVDEFIKDKGMRRFWQIDAAESTYISRSQNLKDGADSLDVLAIWKSINENDGYKHYSDNYEQIQETQKQMETPDELDNWIIDKAIIPADKSKVKYIQASSAYKDLQEYFEEKGMKGCPIDATLGKRLKKLKINKKRKKYQGNDYSFYEVSEECPIICNVASFAFLQPTNEYEQL